jgi:hypothetical protein
MVNIKRFWMWNGLVRHDLYCDDLFLFTGRCI